MWVCAQSVMTAQSSLLLANFHVAWYQTRYKRILLHSHLCQPNSLSTFKFGAGVSVKSLLVWKINISLKNKREIKGEERTFSTAVMVKGKEVLYCFWRFTK